MSVILDFFLGDMDGADFAWVVRNDGNCLNRQVPNSPDYRRSQPPQGTQGSRCRHQRHAGEADRAERPLSAHLHDDRISTALCDHAGLCRSAARPQNGGAGAPLRCTPCARRQPLKSIAAKADPRRPGQRRPYSALRRFSDAYQPLPRFRATWPSLISSGGSTPFRFTVSKNTLTLIEVATQRSPTNRP